MGIKGAWKNKQQINIFFNKMLRFQPIFGKWKVGQTPRCGFAYWHSFHFICDSFLVNSNEETVCRKGKWLHCSCLESKLWAKTFMMTSTIILKYKSPTSFRIMKRARTDAKLFGSTTLDVDILRSFGNWVYWGN